MKAWTFSPTSRPGASFRTAPTATRCAPGSRLARSACTTAATRATDSLQIGNLIGLLVLRKFADAGHNAIALAGGATGMIGDPGGRSKERNLLDAETLARNTKRIADQLERISRVPLVNNLDWTRQLTLLDFLRDVGKHASVNQMIARESVKARLESENGISFTEFSYQLLQANDYLHLCRNHAGRDPDRRLRPVGQPAGGRGPDPARRRQARARVHLAAAAPLRRQEVRQVRGRRGLAGGRPHLAVPVLPVLDERRRTPTSSASCSSSPCCRSTECVAIAAAHAEAPYRREGQRRLAREITTLVHGPEATAAAEEASAILFGGSPAGASAQALEFLATEVPTSPFAAGVTLAAALAATPLASSLSDARRTIDQGAASVNGEVVPADRPLAESDLLYDRWLLLRKGKRNYHLLRRRPANGLFR